jgi:hypothetical protein
MMQDIEMEILSFRLIRRTESVTEAAAGEMHNSAVVILDCKVCTEVFAKATGECAKCNL